MMNVNQSESLKRPATAFTVSVLMATSTIFLSDDNDWVMVVYYIHLWLNECQWAALLS